MQHKTNRSERSRATQQGQLTIARRVQARQYQALLIALVAIGCGAGTKVPEVVDVPTAGTYVGTLNLERRTYAGGIRVDRKSCGATFVAVVDPEGTPWLELDAEECDLGGWTDAVTVELSPLDGLSPTGTPMGRIGGDLPDGTWEGTFLDDGSLTLIGSASSDGVGVEVEWSMSIEAQDLTGILEDDTGM